MKKMTVALVFMLNSFISFAFAQTVTPYAGSIQLKNSQSKIAVVCTGEMTRYTNCSKFQFQILVGSIGSPIGIEIETNHFVLGLDQTLQNYTHARSLTEKQFSSLQDDLNRTLSLNSDTKQVDVSEFDILKDFINHYSDYAALGDTDTSQLEKNSAVPNKLKNVHIFTHASNKTTGATLYLRCKEETCETVIAVENMKGMEKTLAEFPREKLNQLSLSPKLFRGARGVFHSIEDVTRAFYLTPSENMKDLTVAGRVVWNLFIGYTEAYAVTTVALAVTGSVTTIAETPVAIVRSIFAPRKKLKNFIAGNAVKLSDGYYTDLVNQITKLKETK